MIPKSAMPSGSTMLALKCRRCSYLLYESVVRLDHLATQDAIDRLIEAKKASMAEEMAVHVRQAH